MNIINALTDTLGPFYWPAVYFGAIAIFGAPILAFLSLKGVFNQYLEKQRGISRVFTQLGSVGSLITGMVWIGALLSFFPGIFVCSVYCFLGLGLPMLGIATVMTCLFLLIGNLSAAKASDHGT